MPITADQLQLLDPDTIGDESDDPTDPRKRLVRQLSIAAMRAMSNGAVDTGTPDEENPDVGFRRGPSPNSADPLEGGGIPRGIPKGQDSLSTMTGDDATDLGIQPAGFDNTGMPTEFAATADRKSAADRLQRANEAVSPTKLTKKQALIRAMVTMAPAAIGLIGGGGAAGAGAAEGAEAGAEMMHERLVKQQSDAEGQYKTEVGREEDERQQAVREKVAMSQIQAQKAYRTLMASISSRRADTAATNSEINAAGKGLQIVKQPDGSTAIMSLSADQLSELQKAKLGVDEANTALAKARTVAIPEQIKIAEERLKIQQQMLQRSLAALELQQQRLDLSMRAEDYKETGPTTSSKNMGQMADTVTPHIEEVRSLIHEAAAKGFIGPASGRIFNDFLAGKVGSTGNKEADQLLGRVRTSSKLLTSAMLRTHFNGRGISLYGNFDGMLAAKRSEAEIDGTLDEFKDYIHGYSGMKDWSGAQDWTPLRPGARAAASQLKKRQEGSSAGKPPAGARIRDYTDLGAAAGAK